jgi:hypothetical protein
MIVSENRYQPRIKSGAGFFGIMTIFSWSMIFSENRYPPRIKSGAGFFGIML